MNFKGFQKVSSDSKCTTLRHEAGHELKIAHGALSQKMRAELQKIPSREPQKMASGGPVKMYADGTPDEPASADDSAPQQQAPVVVNVNSGPGGQQPPQGAAPEPQAPGRAPASAAPAPDNSQFSVTPVGPQGAAPEVHTPTLAPQPRAPAQASPQSSQEPQETSIEPDSPIVPGTAPEQPQAAAPEPAKPTYQQTYEDYKQAHAQQFAQDDAAFAQDLRNGHVTPETYHDLFAKKDTLGKIGTIFGLMLSGAGSGLTKQPDAVLEMMNNEIRNDLAAQTTSKGNAQNFIKINQAQQLQDATIENLRKSGQLTDAQAKQASVDAYTKSYALSNLQANRVALHNQSLMVAKMPEGPQKEQAKAALAMMSTAVDATNANIGDIAASRLALMGSLGGGGQGQMNTMGMKMIPGMKDVASDIESKNIPGVGMATRPVPEDKRDELQAMNTLDYKANDLLSYIKENKGTLSPEKRAIASQKAEEMMNYYNSSIKGGVMTEGRLKWLDSQIKKNPTSIVQDLMGNTARLEEITKSNASRRDILKQSLGIKSSPSAQGGGQPQGGGNQNSQAIAWAKANPNDPRAGKILKLNGMQ